MATGVLVMKQTANRKLGPIAVTHVAQTSCPTTCPFLNKGCYTETGPQGVTTARLNKSTETALELAAAEAEAIDMLPADRPLRVHVVGDCATPEAAALVGAAMVRYAERGKTFAWTYTHAWRDVPVEAWQGAAVLASCETPAEVAEATARGYATAMVVPEHPGRKVYERGGVKVLPCPQEQGGPQCKDCGLCARPATLRDKGLTVGFAAHGTKKSTVALTVKALACAA